MAKLTKEEKKVLKEAKRLEKLAAAEELRKKLKRDELQREMEAQTLRRRDLERGWREMMLAVKLPVFRQQVEVMWQTFERAFDKKNCLIQKVMQLMEEADAQYGRTVASFCETLDNMTNKLHADLTAMSRDNAARTAALLRRGRDEATGVARDRDAAETHLQLTLYHGRATADELAWRTRGEDLVRADEERDRCLNEIDNLRSYLENTYAMTWADYRAVLKAYVSSTADNQKKVRRLRRKENIMADIIAAQAKQIITNQRNIRKLRYELQHYESGSKQAVFRERRDRHRSAYRTIKRTMERGRTIDSVQLGMVIAASDTAIEWLELAQKKGERILRTAAMCRKFETQREKVLPFGTRKLRSPLQCARDRRGKPIGDALVCEEIAATAGLDRLWQRMSRAHVAREALAAEKLHLRRENAMILQQLQQYKQDNDEQATACHCDDDAGAASSSCRPSAVDGNQVFNLLKRTH